MLNDLTFLIETENIDPSVFQSFWPNLVAVQDDVLAVNQRAFHLNALAGVLFGYLLKICDERILSVPNMRVVLDVVSTRYLTSAPVGQI